MFMYSSMLIDLVVSVIRHNNIRDLDKAMRALSTFFLSWTGLSATATGPRCAPVQNE